MELWTGGTIYTMIKEGETVEAVVTQKGMIVDSGSREQMEKQYGQSIRHVRLLHGATMLPGLVDSHLHLIGVGESLLRLDLSSMTSKQEVLDAVQRKATQLPEGEWIVGDGWNENEWPPGEILHKEDLDRVAPAHPVHLKRVCRHAVAVNSRALELAKIKEDTPDPEGGVIERDAKGLTGVLKDVAQDFMIPALPPIEDQYIQKALRHGIRHAWSIGLTGGHTEDLSYYGDFTRTHHAFQQVIEEENFPFKAHLLVHHAVVEDWHRNGHTFLSGTPYVEFGAMKIFADGALGGRTALLRQPYADDPSTSGVAIHSEEKLKQLVYKARQYNVPVAVHTIGDRAYEMVLDAVEAYPPADGQRDRLIHGQILGKDLIERTKKLPVVIDIQPRFVPSDFPWVIDRIGEENMTYNYAWKTLLEEGIAIAGGSDAPIEPLEPLLGIHAAVTRKKPGDTVVYGEEQCLSMYEAIQLFTTGSALACYHDHHRGLIKPGFEADFTVIDTDPFTEDPDCLLRASIAMTVVDGTIVFEKDPS